MDQITKTNWLSRTRYKISDFVLNHNRSIESAIAVARSIHNFALSKSPLSFIEGGFNLLLSFGNSLNNYSDQFFNESNGWILVAENRAGTQLLYFLLKPCLLKFPHKHLQFRSETDSGAEIGIYDTPVGKIGLDKWGIWYHQTNAMTKNQIMEFLIEEKYKNIESNFFSISSTTGNKEGSAAQLELITEDISPINSQTSQIYYDYLKPYVEKNIPRSILFNGPPGTGKTTLTQTIMNKFEFRTLQFVYKHGIELSSIKFIIKSLKIDAVIIDNFDQVSNTNLLFDFMIWIHENTKLVLLVSNTLKQFHPALLRPERIDEVRTIDKLDIDVVRSFFGTSHPELVEVVKNWPVAFIKELHNRLRAHPTLNIEMNLKELSERIERQAASLKD